jgi:saccharopine dehydrogenase-like NADP-dependent oxidoreductase
VCPSPHTPPHISDRIVAVDCTHTPLLLPHSQRAEGWPLCITPQRPPTAHPAETAAAGGSDIAAAMEPVVLVLGSGLCCPPLVAYLASYHIGVILASRTLKRAAATRDQLPAADHKYVQCVQYDIAVDDAASGSPRLRALLSLPSIRVGVSMLPYTFHVQAAEVAVSLKKHFLTTSYVSPAMSALDASARSAGVLLLNECGVDPGLDHMSAQKLIDRVHAQGGKIVSFHSLCGGLPATSAAANPLQYKLSWSPRGVLLASRNAATYLQKGERKEVSGARLYELGEGYSVEQFGSAGVKALEFYPNRDR